MPPTKKRSGPPHPLEKIRRGLGQSQRQFGDRLGVSASLVKQVEARKRDISQDLSARVFIESGKMIVEGKANDPLTYSKQDHEEWLKGTNPNETGAKALSAHVAKLIQLTLLASARPGVHKAFHVFSGLIRAIEQVKDEFDLEKHINAHLIETYSTETKAYTVRELRDNNLLASMVGFKDEPHYQDDDKIPQTKPVNPMPVKEVFNIAWHHRKGLQELLKHNSGEPSPETVELLEEIQKSLDAEIDRAVPGLR